MHNSFHFDKFTEEWAELYMPMQHHPVHNQRFFMVDNWYSLETLIRELENKRSPAVVLETSLDGKIDDRYDRPSCTVYMIAQEADDNSKAALDAKQKAKGALMAYRNMLAAFKEGSEILNAFPFRPGGYLDTLRSAVQNGRHPLQAIDLNVQYGTTGRVLDGWYGVYATFEDCIAYNRCVDYNDYVKKEYV